MDRIPGGQITHATLATITDEKTRKEIEFTLHGFKLELEHRERVRSSRFYSLKLWYWKFFNREKYSRYSFDFRVR